MPASPEGRVEPSLPPSQPSQGPLRPKRSMTDDANVKHSHPADEKEPTKKAEEEDPKQHGSEAGGAPGEGRTGTGLGSTDS